MSYTDKDIKKAISQLEDPKKTLSVGNSKNNKVNKSSIEHYLMNVEWGLFTQKDRDKMIPKIMKGLGIKESISKLQSLIESAKTPDEIIQDATLSPGIGGKVDRMNVEDLEEADGNFRFSNDKKSFADSVSRIRKVYDNTEDNKKKAKAKAWLAAAKDHKKKMDKQGWEN